MTGGDRGSLVGGCGWLWVTGGGRGWLRVVAGDCGWWGVLLCGAKGEYADIYGLLCCVLSLCRQVWYVV